MPASDRASGRRSNSSWSPGVGLSSFNGLAGEERRVLLLRDGGGDGNRALAEIGAIATPCLDRLYPLPEGREDLDSEGGQLSLRL